MARRYARETVVLEVPLEWADEKKYPQLTDIIAKGRRWSASDEGTVAIKGREATDAVLMEVAAAGKEFGSAGRVHIANNILAARSGKDPKISRLSALPELVHAWVNKDRIDGWMYRKVGDGDDVVYLPYLVTGTYYEPPEGQSGAYSGITLAAVNFTEQQGGRYGTRATSSIPTANDHLAFDTAGTKGRTVTDLLMQAGWYHETPALKESYLEYLEEYRKIILTGFGRQFIVSSLTHFNRRDYSSVVEHAVRVVMDTKVERAWAADDTHSEDFAGNDAIMPVYPSVRVFDLKRHEFSNVLSTSMAWYQYRTDLREKLVLPEGHKDLLDVLTTDLDVFTSDIIDGKSAGNVILAKGIPGVGKTLTAEVYSEIVQRPLYSVHSGELGTNPNQVREELEKVFKLAKRWDAVLLLDEADVFVRERGIDIVHNAIVAEFLRTLEYFDGLLFMTTNRDDIIDEAIISRCAAIITYTVPERGDAVLIWQVLAGTMGIGMTADFAEKLVEHTPQATPRDIKMVLRLAARVAAFKDSGMTIEHVRQAAMFRGVEWR